MTTCSLKQAAATLGIHRNTLSEWIDKGCPAMKRAGRPRGEWEISIPAIFEWRQNYVVREAVSSYQGERGQITKDEADRRRAVAMAIITETEADTVLRNVVLRADAEASQADFCQALKTGLDNASNKIAGRSAIMSNPNEIREMCHAELNRAFWAAKEELGRLWGIVRDGPPDGTSDDPQETAP